MTTSPFPPEIVDVVTSSHHQDYRIVAKHPSWASSIDLAPTVADITYDETRAPRVEFTMSMPVPSMSVINQLDPRTGVRIDVYVGYISESGTRWVYRIADLGLRDRRVSRPADEMTLEASSDEMLLIDNSPVVQKFMVSPSITNAMEQLIHEGVRGAVISEETTQGQEAIVLETVTDRWNTVADLADRIGVQVFDNGLREWFIKDQPLMDPAQIAGTLIVGENGTIINSESGQSRDEWANSVHLNYTWTDVGDGEQREVNGWAYQKTGAFATTGPAGIKTYYESRNVPSGVSAANASARSILKRVMSRANSVTLTAVAMYWLRPGMTINVKLPERNTEMHLVSSVKFNITDGTMQVVTRQADLAQEVRTMKWKGYEWSVRPTQDFHGPGPNAWSDSEQAATIDSNGDLILSIFKDNTGVYRAVELEGPHFGYGQYEWVIDTNPQNWPEEPVLGLFTYDDVDDGTAFYRELDIEFSKWNFAPEPSRSWFSVQPVVAPVYAPGHPSSGDQEPWVTKEERIHDHRLTSATPYRGYFIWQPGQVYFRMVDANGVLLGEHLVNNEVPQPGNETTRMNLWLLEGRAPSNGATSIPVRLKDFTFTPGVRTGRKKASQTVLDFTTAAGQQQVAYKKGTPEQGNPESFFLNNQLHIKCTKPLYSIAYTGSVFDLTDSSVFIRVDQVPDVGDFTTEAIWELRFDDEEYLNFYWSGNHIYAQRFNQGVKTSIDMGEYDPVAHKYWRVTENDGKVFFSTSPNATSWTTHNELLHNMGDRMKMLRMRFECGYFGTNTNPRDFIIGSINKI